MIGQRFPFPVALGRLDQHLEVATLVAGRVRRPHRHVLEAARADEGALWDERDGHVLKRFTGRASRTLDRTRTGSVRDDDAESCLVEQHLVRLLRIDQFDDETLRVLERRRLLVDDGDVDLADRVLEDGERRAESFRTHFRDDEIDRFDGGSFHADG